MTTGTKIRRLREQKRWSQEELAYRVGVSQVTIGNWEQGKSIKHDYLQRLAQALEVTVIFLLEDDQPLKVQKITLDQNNSGEFEITIKAPNQFLEDWHRKMDFLMNKFELPK
ncbi:helix-turn-helix domain-containing protein [Flavobacterium sp.]|jgi:transcriptional regulator with XRE-family HTH domain|uniref:helix-turn-helix domain-containing protein n=1 Tax=Flavobacterium sp. TaxID=239 RepID=UPI0037BE48CF